MKRVALFLPSLFLTCVLFAQGNSTIRYDNKIVFTKVEIESKFPGGINAWASFLQKNLVYPTKALRKRVQGDVVVQFVVDDKGKLSHIEAISGPELLRSAAEDVIRKSPEWIPASNKGIKVKSYKKQPIVFRLS